MRHLNPYSFAALILVCFCANAARAQDSDSSTSHIFVQQYALVDYVFFDNTELSICQDMRIYLGDIIKMQKSKEAFIEFRCSEERIPNNTGFLITNANNNGAYIKNQEINVSEELINKVCDAEAIKQPHTAKKSCLNAVVNSFLKGSHWNQEKQAGAEGWTWNINTMNILIPFYPANTVITQSAAGGDMNFTWIGNAESNDFALHLYCGENMQDALENGHYIIQKDSPKDISFEYWGAGHPNMTAATLNLHEIFNKFERCRELSDRIFNDGLPFYWKVYGTQGQRVPIPACVRILKTDESKNIEQLITNARARNPQLSERILLLMMDKGLYSEIIKHALSPGLVTQNSSDELPSILDDMIQKVTDIENGPTPKINNFHDLSIWMFDRDKVCPQD